jgi:hypothetical protein
LIRVTCAECGKDFEIGDDFAGITEFCPACGALNDIPDSQQDEEEPPQEVEVSPVEDPPARWGIPSGLWWTILIAAVVCFLAACVFLFSDNWESRNVQLLSDATNRGDDFLAGEDYANAVAEYQFVLATVDHRKIESSYIEQLIDRSRQGLVDAKARLRAPPTTVATTQGAPVNPGSVNAGPAVVGPTTEPDKEILVAVKTFQHDSEGLGRFVRQRPVIFEDDKGNWRRRRYVVWDQSYDEPALKEPLQVSLSFKIGSQITEPHFSRSDAAVDDNFVHDESPRIVQCQAFLEWSMGRWIITRNDVNAEKEAHMLDDVRPSLDDFFELERAAFGAVGR